MQAFIATYASECMGICVNKLGLLKKASLHQCVIRVG